MGKMVRRNICAKGIAGFCILLMILIFANGCGRKNENGHKWKLPFVGEKETEVREKESEFREKETVRREEETAFQEKETEFADEKTEFREEETVCSEEETAFREEDAADRTFSDLYYYYSVISDESRELYDLILEGMRRHDAVITLPAHIDDKLKEITQMILNDHPEIFWVDGSYQYTMYDQKTELSVHYLYGEEEVRSYTREIEAAAEDFQHFLEAGDTEYEIVRKAYLYLIDTVEYVPNASDNQNIYSSLVNRKSVCAGYAKATQYLLQKNGIQALYVSGTANGTGVWDKHAWNIVRCDGQYYQVDTTFGDGYTNPNTRMEELGIHNYAYLCIDDDTMYRNHKPSTELEIPRCDSLALNDYMQNGRYADDFDEQVSENMRDAVYSGENIWSYQFSNKEAYLSCLDSIQDGMYSKLVSEYLEGSCQTAYLYDDEMYCILCWY